MTQGQQGQEEEKQKQHPVVREHPEQQRQEETGQEDASDAGEVGRPPSKSGNPKSSEHAA